MTPPIHHMARRTVHIEISRPSRKFYVSVVGIELF